MDKIPPEIIYVVCSLLNVDDILNFRLVNRLFSDIGAAYMLPEVTFYMHQDELDRLEAISLHPIFSKHVNSLTYFAETVDAPKVTWREFLRDHKRKTRWNNRVRKLNLTPSQLIAEYKRYCDAVDEQEKLLATEKDLDLLKEVLPRFARLEALTMSAGNLFYEGRYRTQRKKPFADFLWNDYMSDIHPEGKRALQALLTANAHSPCALTTLRAGTLHWRFFKRNERELTRMFRPLANLTSIELSITVDPADERIHEGNSLRKCQRVLARGGIRNILKSMPKLQCLCIEILNLECDEQEKGAWLRDIIEPGFQWPNLKELVLGGIVANRMELMNVLVRHKDTLRRLCLRDVALASTSWRKLLPDIRNRLRLEEACICGDIHGEREDDDDVEDLWSHPMYQLGLEYWDLSVPEVGSHEMRQSINMYCRHGGEKYPDELPLSKLVVEKYYEEYVEPFFDDDQDFDDYIDDELGPGRSQGENDRNWVDVSDEDPDDAVSDGSMNNTDADDAILFFHTVMAGAAALGYYDVNGGDDNEDHDMLNGDDIDGEGMDDYNDAELDTALPPWIMEPGSASGVTEQPDMDSDDEMPELIP
ncbi:hypothetical protein F5Y14DRAFT_413287 [Nemania sp. NC0429]|nr:hypothetical protein F5Y14DRAFT_413287 [Nemania sp. NC0429]